METKKKKYFSKSNIACLLAGAGMGAVGLNLGLNDGIDINIDYNVQQGCIVSTSLTPFIADIDISQLDLANADTTSLKQLKDKMEYLGQIEPSDLRDMYLALQPQLNALLDNISSPTQYPRAFTLISIFRHVIEAATPSEAEDIYNRISRIKSENGSNSSDVNIQMLDLLSYDLATHHNIVATMISQEENWEDRFSIPALAMYYAMSQHDNLRQDMIEKIKSHIMSGSSEDKIQALSYLNGVEWNNAGAVAGISDIFHQLTRDQDTFVSNVAARFEQNYESHMRNRSAPVCTP